MKEARRRTRVYSQTLGRSDLDDISLYNQGVKVFLHHLDLAHLLEEGGQDKIRVLPETLALALHGETLVVGRRRILAKKEKRSSSIQGGKPNATRTSPSIQAQALALQGSKPSAPRKESKSCLVRGYPSIFSF